MLKKGVDVRVRVRTELPQYQMHQCYMTMVVTCSVNPVTSRRERPSGSGVSTLVASKDTMPLSSAASAASSASCSAVAAGERSARSSSSILRSPQGTPGIRNETQRAVGSVKLASSLVGGTSVVCKAVKRRQSSRLP